MLKKKIIYLLLSVILILSIYGQDVETILADAINGDVDAQYRIATLLEDGINYRKDLVKAKHWYEKAANQGNEKAARRLSALYMNGGVLERKPKLAEAWGAFADALVGSTNEIAKKVDNRKVKVTRKPISFVDKNRPSPILIKPNLIKPLSPLARPIAKTSNVSLPKEYFTVGSNKKHVIAVQGQPTSFSSNKLSFGSSWVNFDSAGKVKGWYSSRFNKLKARIEIDSRLYQGITYFTVGSSKEHVSAVQGQPTSVDSNKLSFGSSWVNFDSAGKVKDWYSSSSNKLKAKLIFE